MRKKTGVGLLAGGVVLLFAAGGALWLRRVERARELNERAQRLLHPPLTEAASWRELRASEAREFAEEAESLAPSARGAGLLREARIAQQLQRGDFAEAERLLASAPAQPRKPGLILLSAALALAQRRAPLAQLRLDALPPALRDEPQALIVRSDIARALGHAEAALVAAESGIARAPRSAALFERRGLARELLADPAGARADLERAAALDRQSDGALLSLGRLRRSAGDLTGAVLAFHEATQRQPDDAEAWLGSGVCRAALGDLVSARVDLERAGALAPARAEPLIALADVDANEGDLEGALRRYRAAVLLDPDSVAARVKLGNTLLRSGAAQDATPAFRAAIERRPDLAAAHNGLGAALLAQGELIAAEDELKRAAELDPNDANPLLNLARLYKRRGDSALLADALAQAEARDPQHRPAPASLVGTSR